MVIYPTLATDYTSLYFSISNDSIKNGSRSGGLWPVYISSSGVITPSDRSLKENIITIPNPLEIIRKLNGVYYCWKKEASCGNNDCRDTGFIAQEVEEVFPEITYYDKGTELWGVNYTKIVGLLTEGIKAVDKENTELESKVSTLETELNVYKEIVNKLMISTSFKSFKESLV